MNSFVFTFVSNFCFVVRSHLLITFSYISFTFVCNISDTDVYILCILLSPRYIYLTLHTPGRLAAAVSVGVLSFITFMYIKYSAIGATLGGVIGLAMYHTVPAYQSFINWQLHLIGF